MTLARDSLVTAVLLTFSCCVPDAEAQEEAACPQEAGRGSVVGELVSSTGTVLIGSRVFESGGGAASICEGDVISVGPSSRAAVYLIEASTVLRLDENSALRIEAPETPGSGIVQLLQGALYLLSQVRRTLTVRTPYVNAGIKGTEIYARTAAPSAHGPSAEIVVFEGVVAVEKSRDGAAIGPPLRSGEALRVSADGQASRERLAAAGTPYEVLRRAAAGRLAWTLYYPELPVSDTGVSDPRLTKAARLLQAGQALRAEALLRQVEGRGPVGGLRDALLASIAVARGDGAEASRLAEAAVGEAPGLVAARLAQSYARQLVLDLDGALVAAEAASDIAPRDPLVWGRLAELRMMQGRIRMARSAAARSVELGGAAPADIALGFAALAAYDARAAEAAFERALVRDSQNPTAQLGLGLALIRQNQLAEGGRHIAMAVALDPTSSLLRSYLGRVLTEQYRGAKAGAQLDMAKTLDPADPTPWYFDASRLLLENRPVEALEALEQSIERNDNRAPYRSRLLLDQDRAGRGANLASIYDSLGFHQLGVNEAAKALEAAPDSAAVRRYVADTAGRAPDQELIRVSETFKAQLLEPPSGWPISPRAPYQDFSLGLGLPLPPGFNEYETAFIHDGLRASISGTAGSFSTFGQESIVSALHGPLSLGAGALTTTSDGFRRNADIENTLYDAYGKLAITEDVAVQIAYHHRDTNFGDITLNGNPGSYDPNVKSAITELDVAAGLSWRLAPGSTVLGSVIVGEYKNRDEGVFFPGRTTLSGSQYELQHILSAGGFDFLYGGGFALISQSDHDDTSRSDERSSRNSQILYGQISRQLSPALYVTGGLEAIRYDLHRRDKATLGPLLGARYRFNDKVSVRAALSRTVKRVLVTEQTLEPDTLMGFPLLFDDFGGSISNAAHIGIDTEVTDRLRIGAAGSIRKIELASGGSTRAANWEIYDASAYAYLIVNDRVTLFAEPQFDEFQNGDPRIDPRRVISFVAPVGATYFVPSGWFARGAILPIWQSRRYNGEDPQSWFSTSVDLQLGYPFPDNRGQISFEATNIFDADIWYQDENYRTNETRVSGISPERAFILRVLLRF